jgi:hydrogenase maturation factor
LLASVPPAHADACVAELRALGYAASAVIGTVRAATAADVWVSLDV